MTDGTIVSGRLVTPLEFGLLRSLNEHHGTAAEIGWRLGAFAQPEGWSALRVLTSLEARQLVECYRRCGGELAWRLTTLGRGPFV